MTASVQNTATTNTFDFWRNRTNELATAMTNLAVTVNSNTAVGNAAITGTMTANLFSGNVAAPVITVSNVIANIVTSNTANLSYINANVVVVNTSVTVGNVVVNPNYLSVGNTSTNVQITTPLSSQISNGQYYLSANGSWASIIVPYIPITNATFTTSGTGTQIIDFYPFATYKAAEYFVSVTDLLANNHYASKITTMHDNNVAYSTEYSQLISNTAVGIFFVDSNTSCVRLNFNPVSSATTVRFTRNAI